jgi:hypothetical protein
MVYLFDLATRATPADACCESVPGDMAVVVSPYQYKRRTIAVVQKEANTKTSI